MIIKFIHSAALAFKANSFTFYLFLAAWRSKCFILLLKVIHAGVVRLRKWGLIVLQTLNYPCGYINKNIYLTIIILFTILIAYFIRLLGLEKIVSIASELSIPSIFILSLLGLNTIWLKFIVITKSYYLLSFLFLVYSSAYKSNTLSLSSECSSSSMRCGIYLFINCLILLLLSILAYKNDLGIANSDPYRMFDFIIKNFNLANKEITIFPLLIIIYSFICAITLACI